MKKKLERSIEAAVERLKEKGFLSRQSELLLFATPTSYEGGRLNQPTFVVERTKDRRFGDFASNVALILASMEKRPPREVAEALREELKSEIDLFRDVERVEIAGPGFMNFYLRQDYWIRTLAEVEVQGGDFGASHLGAPLHNSQGWRTGAVKEGRGAKVQVEFVSANPTGPLHVGHGRGAAVGDVLSNVLRKAGWEVEKEYYINDVGNQMEVLGRSTYLRAQQLLGREVSFPENGYQGEYIWNIAQEILALKGKNFLDRPEQEIIPFVTQYTADWILGGIKKDLSDFGVEFDNWFSERTLHESGALQDTLVLLRERDLVYEKAGALWLKAAEFADEKDRVVVRSSNQPTYFASDIAYHVDKYRRGFDRIIDIWGADHHGYIPRMKAIIQALGYPEGSFAVLLIQLVNLVRGGEQVSMSTRSGEFTTLAELLTEVGKDAARFFYLMRRADAQLDFDLDLAKSQSNENPVFYVQYVHARICSVLRLAEERGVDWPPPGRVDLSPLVLPQELALARQVLAFPDLVEECARSLEPHRLTYYLQNLAAEFHNYYNHHRILSEDRPLTLARLGLVRAIQVALANALALLGVTAPEKM